MRKVLDGGLKPESRQMVALLEARTSLGQSGLVEGAEVTSEFLAGLLSDASLGVARSAHGGSEG